MPNNSPPFLQPRWVVIGTYRICPLPLRPIPPYHKPNKWPPEYLLRSKRTLIKINTDGANTKNATNTNRPPDGGTR